MRRFTTVAPIFLAVALIALSSEHVFAQASKFTVEGFATINYQKFWWQTDSTRRARIDLEKLSIEPSYQLTDDIRFEAEIEIEHGGTGSTMEFDRFEEFGEFEQEIEKGGEVTLEKLALIVMHIPQLNFRIGHIYVPVGLGNSQGDLYYPTRHFTTLSSESESAMIPQVWHENGIEIFGTIGRLSYQAMVVNGLDATGFSSSTWIRRGHQGRFEYVNAEDPAFALRMDYQLSNQISIGASGYFGNSTHNRPKPDMTVPAHVGIVDVHSVFREGPVRANAQLIFGSLQNADAVSAANQNLSNNLNVKRTPVGSQALGWFVEAGFDLMSLVNVDSTMNKHEVIIFSRYDFYDTMYGVTGVVYDNPRWERRTISIGVNYKPHPQIVGKAEFTHRKLGLATMNIESTLAFGLGFEF